MTKAKYSFDRADGLPGFFSSNTVSTDALNALQQWIETSTRSYDVQLDEDDVLVAELSFLESDSTAGQDLDLACEKYGVKRTYMKS